jgi:orotidine-5'-phosphate decarboxylase
MKFTEKLDAAVKKNTSLLCVGLDIDLKKIPQSILNKNDPIFDFNKEMIDATKDLVCAYKPNIAFYEMYGIYGMEALMRTIEYASELVPVILDAKRGDVGHTASAYAKAVFDVYKADAVTINPYMGYDSVEPFLEYKDKGIFILCLTSNAGRRDFQSTGTDESLYKNVARHVKQWDVFGSCGLVVGATNPEELKEIRAIVGDMPILIPGIGAQKGDLASSVKNGMDSTGGRAIINSSRNIIYASSGEDFAEAARAAAQKLRDEINHYRVIC